MYAIVQNGEHQVKVEPGTTVTVDRLTGDTGSEVTFDQVLLVSKDGDIHTGTPYLAGAKVVGVVEDHPRGPKRARRACRCSPQASISNIQPPGAEA